MTHPPTFMSKGAIYSVACCEVFALTARLFSLKVMAQTGVHAKVDEPVTLNFQGADIEAVAPTFASITGKNVVVDPRVKGTVTLVTDKPVSRAIAMAQFVSALRLQGFTLVESGGLYK